MGTGTQGQFLSSDFLFHFVPLGVLLDPGIKKIPTGKSDQQSASLIN